MTQRICMIKGVFFILVGLLVSGCGAEEARAPKTPVTAMQLRYFGLDDIKQAGGGITLKNNKFFMWKDGVTSEDRALASKIAKDIDGYDERALQLSKRQQELSSMEIVAPFITAREDLARFDEDLAKRVQQKKTEESKTTPDPKKLERLASQIAKLEEKIKNTNEEVDRLQNDSTSGPLCREFVANEIELADNSAKGNSAVDEMTQLVDWSKNQPDLVSFLFQADGTISALIRTWSLPAEADGVDTRNYSTDDGSIVNVKYEEMGGRLIFDVRIFIGEGESQELRETYQFDIRRSNYVDGDKKTRIYFSGEMIRMRNPDYCQRRFADPANSEALAQCLKVRKGWAKLVSVNN